MRKYVYYLLLFLIGCAYITFLLNITFYPPYSTWLRFGVTISCTVITFLGFRERIDIHDSLLMKVIFLSVLTADMLILPLRSYMPGILVFSMTQLLLIYRHGRGFKQFLRNNGLSVHRFFIFVVSLSVIIPIGLLVTLVFYPILRTGVYFAAIVVHSLIIGCSLWTALMTLPVSFFSIEDIRLIIAGMVTFFICDLSVGLANVLPHGAVRSLFKYMIWVFYTPALVFLSLSSYRWDSPGVSGK